MLFNRFAVRIEWADCDPAGMTRIAALRNSSFDVEHKALKPAESGERLAIEAWETRVWTVAHPDDPKRLESSPLPPIVIARLSGQSETGNG